MTQLDTREQELGFPSSCSVLIDHRAPIQTPGFRGYFAVVRPVPAEVVQRYSHLTTLQAVALDDAENAVDILKRSCSIEDSASRDVRRTLEPDIAGAATPSAPPSPPGPPCRPASTGSPTASREGHDASPTLTQRCSVLTFSLFLNVTAVLLAIAFGIHYTSEAGAVNSL
eukprot:1793765-Pleurochrysis_carterae.AAC.1